MRINIYTVYSEEADMIFIMKDTLEGKSIISIEVVGFYWGEPNKEATQGYYGSLKVEYEV